MEDLEVVKIYKIYINVYGLKPEILKDYNIEYQSKKYSIVDIINKLIKYNNEIFDFKITNESISIPFTVKLFHNTINEIIIELKEDKSKKFNIDLHIEDEASFSPNIIIKNNQNNSYKCNTYYNNLNISRIVLLNISLDFKIYLEDKDKSKNKTKNIIGNKQKEEKKTKKVKQKDKNEKINDFSLLGKKRKRTFKRIIKQDKNEVKFAIDDVNSLKSNNLLFCIHFFNLNKMVLTISEMDDNISNNNKIITNEQLQNLYLEINNKIDILLKNLEEVDLNTFKERLLNLLKGYTYNFDDVTNNNFKSPNDEYLITMEYFYKFIICNIRNSIKEIIGRFFCYYKSPTPDKITLAKNIIKYILLKFGQFNSYIDYINDKSNNKYQKNLIINKDNLTIHEKMRIYSNLLTIIFSSPIYYDDTKIEFFDINSNDKNIYLMANNLLKKIIDKLQPNSEYLKGLRQTFSKIKKDLNQLNSYGNDKRDVFIIEMTSLKELKEKIKNVLPKRIIRFVNSRSFTNALYDIVSGDIIINEIIYKKRGDDYYTNNNDNEIFDSLEPFVKGNVNLDNEFDKYYYNLYIFKAFWRINHEALGHKAVAKINKNKLDTPNKFIFNGVFEEIQDAGKILEFFVTIDNNKFYSLKNETFNAEKLLNEDLYVGTTFDKFWEEFKNLEKKDKTEQEKNEDIKLLYGLYEYDINKIYDFIYDIYDENIDFKIEKYVRPRIHREECRKSFRRRPKI